MLESKLLNAWRNLIGGRGVGWGAEQSVTYDVEGKCAQAFGRTTKGRRSHGRPMLRREDNINTDLREIN